MKKVKLIAQTGFAILKQSAAEAASSKAGRLGLGIAGVGALGGHAMADGAAPIDMSATGTTIAGYVPTAATAGLTIFAAVFGVIIIKKVFMVVA